MGAPGGGWICSIDLACLADPTRKIVFTSQLAAFKRDAMLYACQAAVNGLLNDPRFAPRIDKPKLDLEEQERDAKKLARKNWQTPGLQAKAAAKAKAKGKWNVMNNLSYED